MASPFIGSVVSPEALDLKGKATTAAAVAADRNARLFTVLLS
jgi:hypothetical protein